MKYCIPIIFLLSSCSWIPFIQRETQIIEKEIPLNIAKNLPCELAPHVCDR